MTYSWNTVARRRLPWTVSFSGYRLVALSLPRRALTLSACRSTSLADHIKNAISVFAPKDILGPDTPNIERIRGKSNSVFTITHGLTKISTDLPQHLRDLIAPIANPSDRLLLLIRSEEVPARVLLLMYQPIMGTLTEKCVLEFAYTLYSASLYMECLAVITQNMALNDVLTLISDELIPSICDQGIDFPDFAVANFVGLFLQAKNTSMATQLSQLLDNSKRYPYINFDNILEEVKLQHKLASARNSAEMLELLQDMSIFTFHDELKLYLQDKSLSLVTRTRIIKSLIAQKVNVEELSVLAIPFISNPGVLRNLVRDITNEKGVNGFEHTILLDLACFVFKTTHLRFHRNDLIALPKLVRSKQDFRLLWQTFSDYLKSNQSRRKNDPGNVRYKRAALIEFLKLAIEFNDPQHAVKIISVLAAVGEHLDNVELATRVVYTIFWHIRAPTKHFNPKWEDSLSEQEQALAKDPASNEHFTSGCHNMADNKHIINEKSTKHSLFNNHELKTYFIDKSMVTSLLVKLSKTLPHKIFTTAVAKALWSSNSKFNLKRLRKIGKSFKPSSADELTQFPTLLFLAILDAFKLIYPKLPAELERPLALVVATQPMMNQLSYFTLPIVSAQGIFGALSCYASVLRFAELTKAEVHLRDCAMLVVMGLVIVSKKQAGHDINISFSSVDDLVPKFEQVINADDSNALIDARSLMIVFSAFVNRDQYLVVLNAADLITKNKLFNATTPAPLEHQLPLRVYFDLMVRAATHSPELSWEVYEWLKMRYHAPVPATVLRRMGCGFAESPHLSAVLSTELVTNVHRILRGRGEPVGPELAVALVDSVIRRGRENGTGSAERLKWAMNIARSENISDDQFKAWLTELSELEYSGIAFWKKRPERRQSW